MNVIYRKNSHMKHIVCDTFLVPNAFEDSADILAKLKEEVKWNEFKINSHVLCRKGSFQGCTVDNAVPWLRCPSIAEVLPMTPTVKELCDQVHRTYGHVCNIAKIQEYIDHKAIINPHSDKTIDLDLNVPIYTVRFGEMRNFVLTHKQTNERIVVPMHDNTLLILGHETNLLYRHSVPKHPTVCGPSYSIIMIAQHVPSTFSVAMIETVGSAIAAANSGLSSFVATTVKS